MNVGVAVGDAFNDLRDIHTEILGILQGNDQIIQPFREIVVQLRALMQYTSAQQLHDHGFADHQVAFGGAFTRGLDIQAGFFNFGYHSVGGLEAQRSRNRVDHRKAVWAKGGQRIFHKIPTAHKIGIQAITAGRTWLIFKKMGILGTDQTAVAPMHHIGFAVNVMYDGAAENNSDLIVIVGVQSGVGIVGDIEANISIVPGGGWIILNRGTDLLKHCRDEEGVFRRHIISAPFSIEFTTKEGIRQVLKITNFPFLQKMEKDRKQIRQVK